MRKNYLIIFTLPILIHVKENFCKHAKRLDGLQLPQLQNPDRVEQENHAVTFLLRSQKRLIPMPLICIEVKLTSIF